MKTTRILFTSALAAAIGAALPATAGLKYWTTGGYDADSYVQEGLVLNYDGIRNVGIDQPHSTAANTVWKNLGSGGTTYDLSLSKANLGAWGEDGFDFKGKTTYASKTAFTIGPQYTVQALLDAKTADQGADGTEIGYVFFPVGSENSQTRWQQFSFAVRGVNNGTPNRARLNSSIYFSNRDISGSSFDYLTALSDGTFVSFFTGTTISNKGNLKDGATLATITPSVWGIGGHPGDAATGVSQALYGTIKSYRHYTRPLDSGELVWNRAVDQARFFGAAPASTIPVTNAVIASAIASVPANEPAGAYAVDASGYTFTAPATKTVNGRTYTCTGYTLETWDAATGDWGTPESHPGELSCAATETSRLRIIWQWTPGDGIVTRYTTADYVQEGLVLHYDGIRNVGADQPHSSDTTLWRNIAPGGGSDLTFRAQTGYTAPGEWRDDGYRFEQHSTFANTSSIDLPANQTIQIAMDANALDQYAFKNGVYANEPYLYYAQTTFGKGASISLRKDFNTAVSDVVNTYFDWTVQEYGDSYTRPRSKMPVGAPAEYVTAILADDFGAVMTGTTIPNANTSQYVDGASRRDFTKGPPTVVTASTGFGIGGNYSDTQGKFKGTIHNFRLYSRVLENEELAWNRMVDDYRFHGVMPVTNVIVATSHSFLSGSEKCGNYEISGTYTFSAPTGTQTDARGFSYAFKGYTLETWDAATQGWSAPVLREGGSAFEYVVGTSPDKVRLTWVWEASGNLRTADNYGLEDLVPNGLLLHFDGIKNIGAECADVTNPTSAWSKAWVNLADSGRYNLNRVNKTTKAGDWTSDGFAFTNTSSTVGSRFDSTGPFTLAPSYSLQVLLDAKVSDQADATCGYMMFNDPWKSSSIAIRTATDYGVNGSIYYVADNAFGENGTSRPRFTNGSRELPYTYATAIIDGKKAMFFGGTDYPTSGTALNSKTVDAAAQELTKLHIGGGQGSQDFTGTLKSFRYYDRVLEPEELKRNRQVDSARYFGELAFTNVVVAVETGANRNFSPTPAPGAYAVEGSYTFTCAAGTDTPDGYKLETWDETTQSWTASNVESLSYTYDAETSPAMVRITWRKINPFVLMMR